MGPINAYYEADDHPYRRKTLGVWTGTHMRGFDCITQEYQKDYNEPHIKKATLLQKWMIGR